MGIDAQVQQQNGPPDWFDKVDLEALANRLNPLLQEKLKGKLLDKLGVEIAAGIGLWQIDSYHQEEKESPGTELAQITEELNVELRRIVVEEYGARDEEVQFAVVRRWGLLAAPENPSCQWERCWDSNNQAFCWWWDCCPCTDTT